VNVMNSNVPFKMYTWINDVPIPKPVIPLHKPQMRPPLEYMFYVPHTHSHSHSHSDSHTHTHTLDSVYEIAKNGFSEVCVCVCFCCMCLYIYMCVCVRECVCVCECVCMEITTVMHNYMHSTVLYVYVCMCVCVCVCVCVRTQNSMLVLTNSVHLSDIPRVKHLTHTHTQSECNTQSSIIPGGTIIIAKVCVCVCVRE